MKVDQQYHWITRWIDTRIICNAISILGIGLMFGPVMWKVPPPPLYHFLAFPCPANTRVALTSSHHYILVAKQWTRDQTQFWIIVERTFYPFNNILLLPMMAIHRVNKFCNLMRAIISRGNRVLLTLGITGWVSIHRDTVEVWKNECSICFDNPSDRFYQVFDNYEIYAIQFKLIMLWRNIIILSNN